MSSSPTAEAIRAGRSQIAARVVDRAFEANPALWQRFGFAGRSKCVEDVGLHLDFLAQAIELGRSELFGEYACWARSVLSARGIDIADFDLTLKCIGADLRDNLPDGGGGLGVAYVGAALNQSRRSPTDRPAEPLSPVAQEYLQALLSGDKRAATTLVLRAVEQGMSIQAMYLGVLQPVLQEVGRLWQTNRISVAQEHYCAATTGVVMSLLYPMISSNQVGRKTVVLACVQGELHELGLRMVADFFEMAGWSVYSTGASLPASEIVTTVERQRADVLAVSCAYAPNLQHVTSLVRSVRDAARARTVKIIVGGHAFSLAEDLWRQVGADGFGRNAADAVRVATQLLA